MKNTGGDALMRVNKISMPEGKTLQEIQLNQETDSELQLLKNSKSLRLQKIFLKPNIQIYCDTSIPKICLQFFSLTHCLLHPGKGSTLKQLRQKYVWPSMDSNITKLVRECLNCQRQKSTNIHI